MSEGMRPSARDILGSMRAESQAAYGGGSSRSKDLNPDSSPERKHSKPGRQTELMVNLVGDKIRETFKEVREGRVGSFAAGLVSASKESMRSPTFWYGVLTAGTVAGVRSLAMHSGGAEASEYFAVAVGGALGAAKEGLMESFKGRDKKSVAGAILTGALTGMISADIGYRSAGSAGWAEAGVEMAKIAATGSLAAFSSFARRVATEGRTAFSGKTLKEMAVSGVLAGAFAGAADWLWGTGVEKTGNTAKPVEISDGSGRVEPPASTDDIKQIDLPPIYGATPKPIGTLINPGGVSSPEANLTPTPTVTQEISAPTATSSPTATVEAQIVPAATATESPVPPALTATSTPVTPEATATATSMAEPLPEPSSTPTKPPVTSTPVPPTVITADPTPEPEARGARSAWQSILDWWNGEKKPEAAVPPSESATPVAPGVGDSEGVTGSGTDTDAADTAIDRPGAQEAARIATELNIPPELIQSGEIRPNIQLDTDTLIDNAPAGSLTPSEHNILEHLTNPPANIQDIMEPLTLTDPDQYYAKPENYGNGEFSSLKGEIEGRIGDMFLGSKEFINDRNDLIEDILKRPDVESGVRNALEQMKGKDVLDFDPNNGAHKLILDELKTKYPDKYSNVFNVGYVLTKAVPSNIGSFAADRPDLFEHNKTISVPKADFLKKVYKL